MNLFGSTSKDVSGTIACLVLAFLCLAGSIFRIDQVRSILNEGERAPAEVVDIYRGSKSLKHAVLEFSLPNEDIINTRDFLPMMVKSFSVGDSVVVLYHFDDPKKATIDVGKLLWFQPIAFGFGFLGLIALAIFMRRAEKN